MSLQYEMESQDVEKLPKQFRLQSRGFLMLFFKYESLTPEKSKKIWGKRSDVLSWTWNPFDWECACFHFLVGI